jgi:hypothetical protein
MVTASTTKALKITLFDGLYETTPRPKEMTWEQLTKYLTTHRERTGKSGGGWSAATYKDGATRSTEGVEAVCVAVVDVDHHVVDWQLIEGREWVAHTTYSHTADDPHWRLAFLMTRSVSVDEWDNLRARIKFWLVPQADEAAKDAARFFYPPICPPGAMRETKVGHGFLLDPDQLPPVPDAPKEEKKRGRPPKSGEKRPGDIFNERADWLDILSDAVKVSEHDGVARIRRPGKRNGWSATIGYGGYDNLYMFTSSWPPFEAGKTYTKFRAHSLLNYGGDDKAAASALAEEYAKEHRNGHGGPPGGSGDGGGDSDGERGDDPTEKPGIRVDDRSFDDVVLDAIQYLREGNDPPTLFVRGGALARVCRDEDGRPAIAAHTVDSLRLDCARTAYWYQVTGKAKKAQEITPPGDVVRAILARGEWAEFPPLAGITQTPILHPDGTIHTDAGYDPISRMWYTPAPGCTTCGTPRRRGSRSPR